MKIIKHFSSEFTPCGCDTSRPREMALPATRVACSYSEERNETDFVCLSCGSAWSLFNVRVHSNGLRLSADHPSEVARRKAAA